VMNNELHTPDPDCFLDGITRRSVMALAKHRQMKVIERPILPEEVKQASEVFLAGTAAEVTPVREIAGANFTPGRVSETLMKDYETLVRKTPEEVARVTG
jgi:branched-chain amino acid aminotransferase